jgi:putative protease
MRAQATRNFEPSDLPEVVDLCERAGAKACLTLNIVCYDDDLAAMTGLLEAARKAGVHAVIAADMAVILQARELGLPVHLSTQANVSNYAAVRHYAQWAEVVVLARELNLGQIQVIARQIEADDLRGPSGQLVQLEAFAHGALCVAVSGHCHMSLSTGGGSANRGACAQNCRRSYTVTDQQSGQQLLLEDGYVMSPRDLCTLGSLDALLAAGIKILKLEGRGRTPDYVQTVTQCYCEAAQAAFDGTSTAEQTQAWVRRVEQVYNRGFWHGGHYLGLATEVWAHGAGSRSTLRRVQLGRVTAIDPEHQRMYLNLTAGALQQGDTAHFISEASGCVTVQVTDLQQGGSLVAGPVRGEGISLPLPLGVHVGDTCFRMEARPLEAR